jgi:ubiquinone/menaquinone biosynthesis C-methylase UbiE
MNPELSPESSAEMLAAAYALDSPESNRALYAKWAATYESSFVVDEGYSYPDRVVEVFVDLATDLRPGNRIVDIGCGTGLAGASLRTKQLRQAAGTQITIDGLDISPEMLAQARQKQHHGIAVYANTIEADLTIALGVADATYAAAISVGTFTHGHVGPEALHEIVRIIRPGGLVVLGVNASHYEKTGFASVLEKLTTTSAITDLQHTLVPIYDNAELGDADRTSNVVSFRRV